MPSFESKLTEFGRVWIPLDKASLNTDQAKDAISYGVVKVVKGKDGLYDFAKEKKVEVKKEVKKEKEDLKDAKV